MKQGFSKALLLLILLPVQLCSADCAAKSAICPGGAKCDAKNCLSYEQWCNATMTGDGDAPSCWDAAPQDDASCASFTWRDPGVGMEFHFVQAAADWIEAERICQKLGYNLLSIENEEEKKAVENFLLKILSSEKDEGTGTVESFLDQQENAEKICDPHGSLNSFKAREFWLGLHYDRIQKKWLHTDGSQVHRKWNPAFRGELSHNIDSAKSTDRFAARLVKFFATDELKWIHYPRKAWRNHADYRNQEDHPQTLCSRRTGRNVTKYADLNADSVCLRGFKCEKENRCILGPNWMDSQMCDGHKDCSDGSDESTTACGAITLKLEDGRSWLFFPTLRRSPKYAARFCKSKGLHLPSIRTTAELDQFFEWHRKYFDQVAHRNDTVFVGEFGDWATLSREVYYILLGVSGKAGQEKTWTHGGSKVNVTVLQLPERSQKELNETEVSVSDPEKLSERIVVYQSSPRGVETVSSFLEQYWVVCEDSAVMWLPNAALFLCLVLLFTVCS